MHAVLNYIVNAFKFLTKHLGQKHEKYGVN